MKLEKGKGGNKVGVVGVGESEKAPPPSLSTEKEKVEKSEPSEVPLPLSVGGGTEEKAQTPPPPPPPDPAPQGRQGPRISYQFGDTPPPLHQGRVTKNLWQVCCNEIGVETAELNSILNRLGLPSVNYCKDKTYPLVDYEEAPNLENSKCKDFLDFWVFPILLPAIQSLIHFAKVNRVFQCRYCSFNSLDYIVEYLYNNNPRYPDRLQNPTPLFHISFVKNWLAKYPRPALPKWLTMTDGEAATIIQRAVRGFLVRIRPDVQEMRQFWMDFKKDLETNKSVVEEVEESPSALFSPYYSELSGEWDRTKSGPNNTHSDSCLICSRFKEFLQQERVRKLGTGTSYPGESGASDFYEDDLDDLETVVTSVGVVPAATTTAHTHTHPHSHHKASGAGNQNAPNKIGSGDNLVVAPAAKASLDSLASVTMTQNKNHHKAKM